MTRDTNQTAAPLFNKTILITRPVGREEQLRQLIEASGGAVIHYPVISITPPSVADIEQISLFKEQLADYTMAIFISPVAVEQGLIYFSNLPKHMKVISLGSKTTQSLQSHSIDVSLESPGHNTESLLATEDFSAANIQNERILIFRGKGGRALLGDTLRQRGAKILYIETYQRARPSLPPLKPSQIKSIDAITISSHEGLTNLIAMNAGLDKLTDIPLIIPAKRTASLARQLGFNNISVANNATDEAMIISLKTLFIESNQ